MSELSWINEYDLLPAEDMFKEVKNWPIEVVPKLLALLEYSKWIGLQEVNLKKHNLKVVTTDIVEFGSKIKTASLSHIDDDPKYITGFYPIDSSTSHLCKKFLRRRLSKDNTEQFCELCPLFKTLKGHSCMEKGEPFAVFLETNDPEKMIDALNETIQRLTAEINQEMLKSETLNEQVSVR